jgi:hypothetical protein
MLEKLYDALRAGNVPDDKARAAAVEVAEFRDSIAEIKSTLRLHSWMLMTQTTCTLVLIGLVLRLPGPVQ